MDHKKIHDVGRKSVQSEEKYPKSQRISVHSVATSIEYQQNNYYTCIPSESSTILPAAF